MIEKMPPQSRNEPYKTPTRCWCGWSEKSCAELHPELNPQDLSAPYRCYVKDHYGKGTAASESRSHELGNTTEPVGNTGYEVPRMPTPEPSATPIRQAWLAVQAYHASHGLPPMCCSWAAFERIVGQLMASKHADAR